MGFFSFGCSVFNRFGGLIEGVKDWEVSRPGMDNVKVPSNQ